MNWSVIINTIVCGVVGFIVGVVSGKKQYFKIIDKENKKKEEKVNNVDSESNT